MRKRQKGYMNLMGQGHSLHSCYLGQCCQDEFYEGNIYWNVFVFQHTSSLLYHNTPDSKVHGTNMGPIWGRQDPGGPHVGPTNFAIWDGVKHELQSILVASMLSSKTVQWKSSLKVLQLI